MSSPSTAPAAGVAERPRKLPAAAWRWYDGSLPQLFVRRLGELQFVNTITLFGATFLLSALPLMILVSSFASRRIDDDISRHLGLDAQASGILSGMFRTPSTSSVSAVVTALALTLAGTVAVARSTQVTYEQIFRQEHHRRGNLLRLVLWVAALCAWLGLGSATSAAAGGSSRGLAVDAVVSVCAATAFFWWSMRLLLAGRVPWRALFAPALVTGLYWLGLQGFAGLFFSSTITSDSRLYGRVGVVFSLLTWFIAFAAVVLLGALTGAVWSERRRATRSARPAAGQGHSTGSDRGGD